MIVSRVSILTNKLHQLEIDITPQQLDDYNNDRSGLIHEAFPNLNAGEREFIMSGIHPDEWDEIFGKINQ